MRLVGARANVRAQPQEAFWPAIATTWWAATSTSGRTHVPNYGRVRYPNIYPGIDVVYYGNPGELEFDFIYHPGRIQLELAAATSTSGCRESTRPIARLKGVSCVMATASPSNWHRTTVHSP